MQRAVKIEHEQSFFSMMLEVKWLKSVRLYVCDIAFRLIYTFVQGDAFPSSSVQIHLGKI